MQHLKHRRAFLVILAGVVVIPVAVCLTVAIGSRLAGPWILQTYEDRMYETIAARVRPTETGQTQVVVTDHALTNAFSSLPSLGGIYPRTIEFSTSLLGGRLGLHGNTRLRDVSISFEPMVQDGRVQLVIRHFILGPGAEPPGVSEEGVRSALEAGINRALEDAGYRAIGVKADNGLLTIFIEAIPSSEPFPSWPA